MHHVNPDVLALLALGEHVGTPAELAHLDACGPCAAELNNLSRTAVVARSTLAAGEFIEPSSRVWTRIRAELALDGAVVSDSAPSDIAAPAVSIVPRLRRRALAPLAAAAALVLIVGAVGATWLALRPTPPTVLASATLTAFPSWAGSNGEALLEQTAAGARVVQISLDAPDDDDAFREVWLITSDATELVSLGVLDGGSGTFTVPDGLDLSRYDQVDISSERFDGDPDHSGDSILRGQLS
ncbi:MAG: anti-sigma factor [Salinibacterium sp.]|nr:anti-sigma factor [Salinibacterium sp.]